jgi:hypothetical protein
MYKMKFFCAKVAWTALKIPLTTVPLHAVSREGGPAMKAAAISSRLGKTQQVKPTETWF